MISEIADISYKILQFSKDTWEFSLSPEQVILSIRILNIQNSTQARVNQIQSNCIHLYSIIHYTTPEDIPQDIWKTLKKRHTFIMLIIDDIYKTLREKISIFPQEFLDTISSILYKKQPIKIRLISHSEHCVIIYLQTLQMDGEILNTNFRIYPENKPHHSNHRNPYLKAPLSCLVIEWCLHPEPYTENSSDKCKYPEVFFGYSPPLVYGFEFVYPHDCVGKEIDDEEIYSKYAHTLILKILIPLHLWYSHSNHVQHRLP